VTQQTTLRRLPKILWFTLALFTFVNALEALRYLLPHVPFPCKLTISYINASRYRCTLWVARSPCWRVRCNLSRASVKAIGIVIASWDGSTAAPCLAGALHCGSRRIRKPVGSLPRVFSSRFAPNRTYCELRVRADRRGGGFAHAHRGGTRNGDSKAYYDSLASGRQR
jgi:hypothetical protein